MPTDKENHDKAVRDYRDAVETEAREARDKIADENVDYVIKIGKAARAAERLRIYERNQKIAKNILKKKKREN
jgi:hypothetical protein